MDEAVGEIAVAVGSAAICPPLASARTVLFEMLVELMEEPGRALRYQCLPTPDTIHVSRDGDWHPVSCPGLSM